MSLVAYSDSEGEEDDAAAGKVQTATEFKLPDASSLVGDLPGGTVVAYSYEGPLTLGFRALGILAGEFDGEESSAAPMEVSAPVPAPASGGTKRKAPDDNAGKSGQLKAAPGARMLLPPQANAELLPSPDPQWQTEVCRHVTHLLQSRLMLSSIFR